MKIKFNKGQGALFVLVLIAVTVAFVCFFIFDVRQIPSYEGGFLDNEIVYWFVKVLCLVCAIFTTLSAGYFFKKLFSNEPLIEICDEYFWDNSSAISFGRIEWSDIEKVYLKGFFFVIKLKNPAQYLSKMNKLQLFFIKTNKKMGFDEVCISAEHLKKDWATFIEEFNKRFPLE